MKPLLLQDSFGSIRLTQRESLFNKLNYNLIQFLIQKCVPIKGFSLQKHDYNMCLARGLKHNEIDNQFQNVKSNHTKRNKALVFSKSFMNRISNSDMTNEISKMKIKIKIKKRNISNDQVINNNNNKNKKSNLDLSSKNMIVQDNNINTNTKCFFNSIQSSHSKRSTISSTPIDKKLQRIYRVNRVNSNGKKRFNYNYKEYNSKYSIKKRQVKAAAVNHSNLFSLNKSKHINSSNNKSMSSLNPITNRNGTSTHQIKNSSFSININQSNVPFFENPVLNENCGFCLYKINSCINRQRRNVHQLL